jgi:hypothetical protein
MTNMQKPDDLPDDLVDAVLGAAGRRDADDDLRGAVLAQTIGVVRRRRRLKRCALAASLLGCYLAGIMTVSSLLPFAQRQEVVASSPLPLGERQGVRASLSPSSAPKPRDFQGWRRVADRYLQESDDIVMAVAGYRQALDLASDKELAIEPGQDNWLLMALKDARAKERKDACFQQN